ncbi:MAG: hypothetical protein ACKOE2_16205, partial [Actinomycetales bacterium]
VCREPVLIIGFNRPDQLREVIARVREVQPTRLYLAVDGPRPDRPGEAALVQACRDLVDDVDWPCEVRTRFSESNLGCGQGVSTAITWFFEHEERGIILEDDVVADVSFFGFCSELLEHYQHDERIFAISGCCFVPPAGLQRPGDPYRFSRVAHVWGWATWRRTWSDYRLDIAGWRRGLGWRGLYRWAGRSLRGLAYWASNFEMLGRRMIDTWDVQLNHEAFVTGRLTATSNVNLVRNIGFGETATHTVVNTGELQPVGSITLPTAPVSIEVDERADAWTRRHHFKATWFGMAAQLGRYVRRRIAGVRARRTR